MQEHAQRRIVGKTLKLRKKLNLKLSNCENSSNGANFENSHVPH
jgi:hypothetical protein